MSVVDPNLVIFMGDLLDEGVGMTEAQFIETRSRFQSIFPASSADTVHIPGDNDIGGEMERIYPSLVNRFAQNFPLFVGNASRYANFNIAVVRLRFGEADKCLV
ncbi:hypothetical protein AAVH_03087 [Aphelenchoides avenae]|nr:hypothetical protein AAVH_03087 [Aphelenchus avenae]